MMDESPRLPYSNGMLAKVARRVLEIALIAAVGYFGALLGFSARLSELERSNREWQYIQCNGVLSPRARAAVAYCRGIPPDPALRALMRDTS